MVAIPVNIDLTSGSTVITTFGEIKGEEEWSVIALKLVANVAAVPAELSDRVNV